MQAQVNARFTLPIEQPRDVEPLAATSNDAYPAEGIQTLTAQLHTLEEMVARVERIAANLVSP